ncbi:MAG TPA: response regulator transcription factor [Clostridia bacterium]|nr:response regulator transcription factor [Clostridia bacterium]
MFHILVVEDEPKLRQLLCTVLIKNGYHVTGAEDGRQALAVLEREYVDLMICDILMPNMDGCELTRSLRDAGYALPVLMVTACETFFDKQRGFLAGTDDYMVKPIDVNEMLLRIGALLRRAKIISERQIICGNLTLNYDALTVSGDGINELLPQKEFYLLYKLLAYAGKIFTRQQLMDEIWGMDSATDARTVDVHINRLRERFRDHDDFEIITVRGLGYKAEKRNES